MSTHYFILARFIEDVEPTEPISVTPVPCSDCQRVCGISPSSVQAIAEHGWPVKCRDCLRQLGSPIIFAQLPGAIDERRVHQQSRLARELVERRN